MSHAQAATAAGVTAAAAETVMVAAPLEVGIASLLLMAGPGSRPLTVVRCSGQTVVGWTFDRSRSDGGVEADQVERFDV